jgi:glycine hydroxymethyltransferase
MGLKFSKGLSYNSLKKSDQEVYDILLKETKRQQCSLELIASENYTSVACMQGNASIFTNKYAEGYPAPGRRYYGGCEHIDELELLTQKRALEAFNLDPKLWGVNVQALSGSPANFAVYSGLLKPGDSIMGMKLTHGGHLSHSAVTPSGKALSSSSVYFKSAQYGIDTKTNLIDYSTIQSQAMDVKPRLIIVGASAYSRDYNYQKFREIADEAGSLLMADVAHTAGLIASGILNSPFDYCDVVTTTTHKTLRMARGALIFYKLQYKDQIDYSVFPLCQGGAHYNTISAICTGLKQVNTPEFKEYSKRVVKNAQHLSKILCSFGFNVLTGGTDNHLLLIDLSNHGINGAKYEKIAELCGISLNKNTVASDTSALNPSGIRVGTPAMTTRGFTTRDFEFTANIMYDILVITKKIHGVTTGKKLVDFTKNIHKFQEEIDNIKKRVTKHCKKFPLPQVSF